MLSGHNVLSACTAADAATDLVLRLRWKSLMRPAENMLLKGRLHRQIRQPCRLRCSRGWRVRLQRRILPQSSGARGAAEQQQRNPCSGLSRHLRGKDLAQKVGGRMHWRVAHLAAAPFPHQARLSTGRQHGGPAERERGRLADALLEST